MRLGSDEPASGLEDLGQAGELAPTDPGILVNLGVAMGAAGLHDEETSCYESALELDPKLAPAQIDLARALLDKGRADLVAELLDPLLEDEAITPALLGATGCALFRAGAFQKAQRAFARAATDSPDEPRFGYNLAVSLLKSGNRDRAREAFALLATLPAVEARACTALAHLARESFDAPAEVRYLEQAVRADPGHVPARVNLASALLVSRNPDVALGILLESPVSLARCGEAQFNLALCLEATGELDQATRAYRRASRLLGGRAEVLLNRAFLCRAKGQTRKEAALLRRALRVDPGLTVAGALLGLARLLSDRPRKALGHLGRL
ncbi:MAG: tetratricopeptide repeat protein [Candidatus Riflebacteria bacterium]|nr:tetratricopeptide repeat protein [Candidatus Riflebacteria bacterium]